MSATGDVDPPRVFVSSTFQDLLVEIRDVLCSDLEEMNVRPVMCELPSFPYTFGQRSVDRDAIASVASAQLYLLVIGRRYGTIDPHERLSLTEMEWPGNAGLLQERTGALRIDEQFEHLVAVS
jgi:hypothetical protein